MSSKPLFIRLGQLGTQLLDLHQLKRCRTDLNPLIDSRGAHYPIQVNKVSYERKTIWLDQAQTYGFSGVSEQVWTFKVGGYQVCKSWFKDRQAKGGKKTRPGLILTPEEIKYYQKLLFMIKHTLQTVDEIDLAIEESGGWPKAFE